MTHEIWKQIPEFEGLYEASNKGGIRSVPRTVSTFSARAGKTVPLHRRGRVMSLHKEVTGYLTVCLSKNGKRHTKRVNMLVCSAFHGERPDGLMCCHNDGEKTNNSPENLRWDTAASNQKDRIAHGTHLNGADVGTAKITESEASKIKSGMRPSDAIKELRIGKTQFHRIKRGESWRHISGKENVRLSAPEEQS